ncbi:MAG: hypothetical protein ACE5DM_00795, partial [Candidatus Nanoarchaeia archaeon]
MARRKTAGSAKRVGPKNVKKPKRRPVKKAAKTPKKVKKRRSANRPENKSAKKAEPVVAHHISIQRQFLRPKKERLPSIFHHYPAQIIASVVTLYVIMYLFKKTLELSFDVVFFSVFVVAALVVADLFYRHEYKPHDALVIICLFILPPMVTAILTEQLWAWVLLALMIWALATAIVVFYHHKKGKHLTEVMWVSVYSHLLAFGAALLLFALLSYFRPPVFLTGIQA